MPAKLLTAVFVMLLAGCASSPRSVILHPQYQGNSSNQLPLALALQVNDLRTTKYTIRVKDQEPALYMPDANLPLNFQDVLQQALAAHGAEVIATAATQLEIDITRFKAIITESLSQHQSQANAAVTVRVTQGTRRFEKQYQGNANLTGPLQHSQAGVEQQLNQLAQQLVSRIVQDPELINFVRGS